MDMASILVSVLPVSAHLMNGCPELYSWITLTIRTRLVPGTRRRPGYERLASFPGQYDFLRPAVSISR